MVGLVWIGDLVRRIISAQTATIDNLEKYITGDYPDRNTSKYWTLNKVIVLVLIGGFGVVLLEVRYDHRSVLAEGVVAWIPIIYSVLMMVASVLGLLFWSRGGRQALLVGFLVAILVGLTGFWFHTDGRLLRSIRRELSAWVRKIPDEDKPPALAPLAFAGFGILGALACSKPFQPSNSIRTAHAEEEIPPEFVYDAERMIPRQTSTELSNFVSVRDVTARLQIQDSPSEISFC